MNEDHRVEFFGGARWYPRLIEPVDEPSAWSVVKGPLEDDMWAMLLNAALGFALAHDLLDPYRKRFEGLSLGHFTLTRAEKEGRTQSFPIWDIANELVVGSYLERVLGWRLTAYRPPGKGQHVGEWQFKTGTEQSVFVEVKSLKEPIIRPSANAYSHGIDAGRIAKVLDKAYDQLPNNDCGTLVVLVGNRPLWTHPTAPLVGAVPAALFGHFGISFQVLPYDPESERAGPSFHDTFVQEKKNRKLGCVAALRPAGLEEPTLAFYAIHNPYAHESAKIDPLAFGDSWQMVFNGDQGQFVGTDDPTGAWAKIRGVVREH